MDKRRSNVNNNESTARLIHIQQRLYDRVRERERKDTLRRNKINIVGVFSSQRKRERAIVIITIIVIQHDHCHSCSKKKQ